MKNFCLGVLLSFLLFFSCNENREETSPDENAITKTEIIKGKVIAPAGINTTTLSVVSPVEVGKITEEGYTVKSFSNNFNTQIIQNAEQKVLLLGYSYPGQTNFDISSRSTALALIMNTEAGLFLTNEGKKQLINLTLSDPDFNKLAAQIQNSASSNRNLFDTTNVELMQALKAVVENVIPQGDIFRTSETPTSESVNIFNSGKNFIFNNSGSAITSVVGIYKDQERLQQFVVDGLAFAPTSVGDVFSNPGIYGEPVDHPYALPSDGEYQIKIRTGRPGTDDNSDEHKKAFYENLGLISSYTLGIFLPNIETQTCNKKKIATNIINLISAGTDIYAAKSAASAVYMANAAVFQSLDDIIGNCNTIFTADYFKSIAGVFTFIDKTLGMAGNAVNLSVFAYQWAKTKPSFDTCYTVTSGVVEKCPDDPTGWYQGKYELKSSPWMTHACQTRLGETGDVYFYVYKNTDYKEGELLYYYVFYAKSIFGNIGNQLDLSFVFIDHTNNYRSPYSVRPGKTIHTDNQQDYTSFHLGYAGILPKVRMQSDAFSDDGYIYHHVPAGKGCGESDYEYAYKTLWYADYSPSIPSTLTAAEVQSILNLAK